MTDSAHVEPWQRLEHWFQRCEATMQQYRGNVWFKTELRFVVCNNLELSLKKQKINPLHSNPLWSSVLAWFSVVCQLLSRNSSFFFFIQKHLVRYPGAGIVPIVCPVMAWHLILVARSLRLSEQLCWACKYRRMVNLSKVMYINQKITVSLSLEQFGLRTLLKGWMAKSLCRS